jgi:hypothetical protein
VTAEGPALVQVYFATIFIPRAHWLHFVGFFALYGHGVRLSSIELERSIQRERDKPTQGVVASTHAIIRSGVGGFIDWVNGLIDMQIHVLNAFATAVSNDNIR